MAICAATIDGARLTQVLLSHEARVHRFGWDQTPPQLFVVYDIAGDPLTDRWLRGYRCDDRNFTTTTRVAGYAAKALVTHWPAPPVDCLKSLAIGMAHGGLDGPAGPMLELMSLPGILAVGWVDERWSIIAGPDIMADAVHGRKSIKDMEGRKEERCMWGLELTGRLHTVMRERGGRPRILGQPGVFHGSTTTPLRMIVAAITGTVPPVDEWPLVFPDLVDLFQPADSPLHERTP